MILSQEELLQFLFYYNWKRGVIRIYYFFPGDIQVHIGNFNLISTEKIHIPGDDIALFASTMSKLYSTLQAEA